MERDLSPCEAPTIPRNDPLYWSLDQYMTPVDFEEGFVKYLGITGGGKTRRLMELLHKRDDVLFTTASTLGNGGGKALERLCDKLAEREWTYEEQRYFFGAFLFSLKRFHASAVLLGDAKQRVASWVSGCGPLDNWMELLPDPPPADISDAIRRFRGGQVYTATLLLDEIQAVPPQFQAPLFGEARRFFKSVVVSGTGVSNDAIEAAWRVLNPDPSPSAGKIPPFKEEPGPDLLSREQVMEYWQRVGAGGLGTLVSDPQEHDLRS
eukprot:696820-Rhodomonas_salina.1